jgi:hypothetical protein
MYLETKPSDSAIILATARVISGDDLAIIFGIEAC